MDNQIVSSRDDRLLWNLLGLVELTYHPLLAIAALLAVGDVVSPVPAVTFDPLSVTGSGQGLPITTVLAVVVLVDLASDVLGVYATGWTVASSEDDE